MEIETGRQVNPNYRTILRIQKVLKVDLTKYLDKETFHSKTNHRRKNNYGIIINKIN